MKIIEDIVRGLAALTVVVVVIAMALLVFAEWAAAGFAFQPVVVIPLILLVAWLIGRGMRQRRIE
jgi:ABC-type nickel/cobalt efflux system permease component RcnA